MADTTFVPGTPIVSDWLNDVNDTVYGLPQSTTLTQGIGGVGMSSSLNYPVGNLALNYFRDRITILAIPGCPTNGTSDASAAMTAALATGKTVIIPYGYTFCMENVNVPTNARIEGGGTIKKLVNANQLPVLYFADEAENVVIKDITIDGSRASYAIGNPVMAVLGHLCQKITFSNVSFINIIDVGVKLRNSSNVTVIDCFFYNIGENGVELKNYDVDVRTGLPYTGTLPPVQGGHKVTKSTFAKIDNGSGDGSGDGCGILIASSLFAAGTPYPIKGYSTIDNDFWNVKRGVWIENNDVGCESLDGQINDNRFYGDVTSYGGDVYQAIGLIGAKRATVKNNTITNVGNMAVILPADSCNGIVVSGTSEDIIIRDNIITDNTGVANRMDYGIRLTQVTRCTIVNNTIQGASESPINVASATVSGLVCHSNDGAQDVYSWGDTIVVSFKLSNIPGTATTALTPEGYIDDTEIMFPMPVTLVGISAKQTNNIAGGTITYRPYTGPIGATVNRSALNLTNADFASTQASKTIAMSHADAVTIPAGNRVRCEVVTVGFTPTTADVIVQMVFEVSRKE